MKGKLILENGMTFEGRALGHISERVGEAVFTTSSLGYTELISNPSLLGKIVIMTSPLVGSRGVVLEDMESKKVWAAGLIAREVPELSGSDKYDLFLDGLLREHRVMGIDGIDTRYLTQTVRNDSPMKAIITTRDLSQEEVDAIFQKTSPHNSWESVSCREKHLISSSEEGKRIGILDLGVKKSFLELFSSLGYNLVILPWNTSSEEILSLDLDALILSDGPEDFSHLPQVVSRIENLVGRIPLLGVSMGYKLLSLTLKGEVENLNPSCRNIRVSVKDLHENLISSVSQSYPYRVSDLPRGCTPTHVNLKNNNWEGFENKNLKIMGINFNLQGPRGESLLDNFLKGI